jgi:hypothetical protein
MTVGQTMKVHHFVARLKLPCVEKEFDNAFPSGFCLTAAHCTFQLNKLSQTKFEKKARLNRLRDQVGND